MPFGAPTIPRPGGGFFVVTDWSASPLAPFGLIPIKRVNLGAARPR